MQENENEKKKLGFFGKIKNILFVDDETIDETKETPILPDYKTRQEDKEEKQEEVIVKEIKEEHQVIGSRLNNEKREFTDVYEPKVEEKKEEVTIKEEVKEEKESPFFSFDEDEFKRLTSRVARSEAINKEHENMVMPAIKPSYNTNNISKHENKSSILSSVNTSSHPGRKPFVPSPVISPVYGILDKNYSKEDIVDKRTDRKAKTIDSLDRVRTKAFGTSKQEEIKEEVIKEEVTIREEELPIREKKEEVKIQEAPTIKEVKPKEEIIEKREEVKEEIKDLELPSLDNKVVEQEEKDVKQYTAPIEEELNNMINNQEEEELVNEDETNGINMSAKLDDLEKTSTLKILDDIEKELNNIKPMNEEEKSEETEDKKDQTFEKDIFDMISSMYEGGDEEDDSD